MPLQLPLPLPAWTNLAGRPCAHPLDDVRRVNKQKALNRMMAFGGSPTLAPINIFGFWWNYNWLLVDFRIIVFFWLLDDNWLFEFCLLAFG